jgi:hypothetical protein
MIFTVTAPVVAFGPNPSSAPKDLGHPLVEASTEDRESIEKEVRDVDETLAKIVELTMVSPID